MNHFKRMLLVAGLLLGGMVHAEPVNINSADAGTIAQYLSGIGMVRAEAIVAYRTMNGPFESVEDLMRVQGIGPALLEANRHNIRLSDSDTE